MSRRKPPLVSAWFAFVAAGIAWLLFGYPALAQWNPAPQTQPPGQNLPGPIWNASAPGFGGPQSASVSVTGAGSFGGNLAITGSGGFGGFTPTAGLALSIPQIYIGDGVKGVIIGAYAALTQAGDVLADGKVTAASLRVTTAAAAGKVLVSDADGNATWQTLASGCSSGVFGSLTGPTYTGSVLVAGKSGYAGANEACGAGSHICTPDEIIHTVRCAPATLPGSGNAWLANGAPSFTSPAANDCAGFTSANAGSYGSFWQFSGTAGGKGLATSCNLSLKIACCI